ncbi:MAG: hypothetical protein ACE5JI_13940, partial [Acidobacteriota bacterium]
VQKRVVMKFALQKPAFRIIVNSSATHGAVGFSTGLDPAMTLGCGAYGGNITSDNITPMHLINRKRLAFETRPVDLEGALAQYNYLEASSAQAPSSPVRVPAKSTGAQSMEEQVSQFLERRGFQAGSPTRRGEKGRPGPSSDSQPLQAGGPGQGSAGTSSGVSSPAPVAPLEFISEREVREALQSGRKLPVGPLTLITPAARELGNENNVFLRV